MEIQGVKGMGREQNEGKGAGKDTEMTGEQEGIAEGAFERN